MYNLHSRNSFKKKAFKILKYGQILVSRCGRGYDIAFVSSLGSQVVGWDVSEKAVEAARSYADK